MRHDVTARTFACQLALALAASCAVGACSRQPAAETSEAVQPQPPATSAVEDGTPHLAMAPDGVHIQYRVYGAGEPAVALVHGWSGDSSYWNAQLAALKAKYTVLTVDLAGHGGSGRNRTDWSMANYGEDVAAAVGELETPRVVLVGHSMGGPVALEAASRLGDRVIGVIGVDTFKTLDQPPPHIGPIERRIEDFRRDFIGTTREFVAGGFFQKDADPLLVRKIAGDMSLAPPEVAIPSLLAVNSMRFEDVLPKVSVPIIAINSDLPPGTDGERIRESVPTFRLITLERTGHFLMLEKPDQFNTVLLREIAALAGGVHE
jgi:pimeloyl-ACP methyl ester carboxylesterase